MEPSRPHLLRAVLIAVGIALAGWFVGNGFVRARASDRHVTVKGIAERKVQADVAFWPISLSAADNDLRLAQARINGQIEQIKAFLVRQGLDTSGFEVQSPNVSDAFTNLYRDPSKPMTRYVVQQTLMVYSEKPQSVAAASRQVGELVSAGMVLSGQGPIYLFTRLNDIKPEMIAEATKRAREAAEQFARDSGGRLEGIRQANQGVFEIQPRDPIPGASEENQLNKTVRVVTTVQYALAG